MYHNIGINWESFNYIFSGSTQYAFEQLAYILFCHEFNQEKGVFRYFNQAGIETQPIKNGKEIIGFQAKYYDSSTKFSSKVSEFTRMVDTAKKKNPELTKIHVYVNKEMSESNSLNKKKPKYQEDIEDYAKIQNIIIEWRVPSHIERMLFSADIPSFIRDFFFNPEQGIRKFIEQINLHTETLVNSIDNSISYNKEKIKIDYSDSIFLNFLKSENDHLVIHGYSGTGKSGLIKSFYNNSFSKMPIFIFKATDFGFNNLSEFGRQFGDCTINDFLSAFSDAKNKVIIIDSAEKRFSMSQTVLDTFLNTAVRYNWKIIHTIRSLYKDNYLNFILKTKEFLEHPMKMNSIEKINGLLSQCNIPVPKNVKMKDLICNLFYLNLYINTFDESVDYSKSRGLFLTHIWNYKVKGIPHNTDSNSIIREQLIFDMLKTTTSESSYFNSNKFDRDISILQSLRFDEVIDYDDVYKGYYFAHDIYEELAAWHFINYQYQYYQNSELEFHNSLSINMPMRKHYRSWIHDKLHDDEDTKLNRFIIKSITNHSINKIWKDELLIALMESENNITSLLLLSDLLDSDTELLKRVIFLVNTTCKVINYDSASNILTPNEIDAKTSLLYRFTKPSGVGWQYIIDFVYKNLSNLKWDVGFITLVYDIIASWIKDFKQGHTTKQAGTIALHMYRLFENEEIKYLVDRDLKKKLSVTILESSFELEDSLLIIFNEAMENDIDHRDIYFVLIEELLGNVSNSIVPCQVMPEIVVKICQFFWKRSNNKTSHYLPYNSWDTVEDAFGVSEKTHHNYHPTSALWTPAFMLLQSSPKIGIDFVINFVNSVTENYEKSNLNSEYFETYPVTLILSDGTEINQICSNRLWMVHRGGSSGPNLLECILMALEKWLLNNIPIMDVKQANSICDYLLRNSKSVAITSVINSIVLAHPKELFITACSLISLGEVIFLLDNQRLVSESTNNWFRGLPNNKFYDQERINSNNLPFRKTTLEKVLWDYQLKSDDISQQMHINRLEKLYSCIDLLDDKATPENTTLRYALNRIDFRRFKPNLENKFVKDGKEYVFLEVEEEDDLTLLREERQSHDNEYYRFSNVSLWARAKFENDLEKFQKYDIYEINPLKAFEEMILIQKQLEKCNDYDLFTKSAPIYISAVLLNFYESDLAITQKEYCKEILLNNLDLLLSYNINDSTNGNQALVASLPYLIRNTSNHEERFNLNIVFLFAIFLDYSRDRSHHKTFSNTMWEYCPDDAENIFKMFVSLKPNFEKWRRENSDRPIEKFVKSNKKLLNKVFKNPIQLEELSYSLLDSDSILSATMLLDVYSNKHFHLIKKITPSVWRDIFENNHRRGYDKNINYELEASYIKWLSQYIYNTKDQIRMGLVDSLEPFLCISDQMENFLSNILIEHDSKKDNKVFWQIWNKLYYPIIRLCLPYKENIKVNRELHEIDEVLSTYCFAWLYWGDKQKEWIGVQISHLTFFDNIVKDIGFLPITLYSISRFINSVGYSFVLEGLKWISKIISENDHLVNCRLQTNTLFYLEELVIRISVEFKDQVKRNPTLRKDLLCVLNFLVLRGSTIGFFIREEFF